MTRPWHIGFGILLTALAGFVDALGFIQLGGLYTSLVSGNMAQFAIALGHYQPPVALLPAVLIVAFLAGAFGGGMITALAPERWATSSILGFEAAAVASAYSLVTSGAPIAVATVFLAVAMGVQNAALAQVQGFRAGTTFVTGALFAFGQKLALALLGRGRPFAWLGDGVVWLAFLLGAFAGTLVHARLGIGALAVAAVVTACICAGSIVATLLKRSPATARDTPMPAPAAGGESRSA